jgi:hypothetical protein
MVNVRVRLHSLSGPAALPPYPVVGWAVTVAGVHACDLA